MAISQPDCRSLSFFLHGNAIIQNPLNSADEPVLSSIQNPWVKQLRRLHQSADRKAQQVFLCEGTHLLQEAISTHWPIDAVCFTEQWAGKHSQLLESLFSKTRRQLVTQQVLNHLATTEHPDGVITIARFRGNLSLKSNITLGLGIETLQEPGNLGALIRASVATAADGIWLSPDSVDPVHPKVLRASAGQWFRQSIIPTPLPAWVAKCRAQRCQILAAASGGRSYWAFDFTKPTIFLLGNEGAGLTQSLMQLADDVVSIPMAPGVESLNVATTGALLLYEAMRQRNCLSTNSTQTPNSF